MLQIPQKKPPAVAAQDPNWWALRPPVRHPVPHAGDPRWNANPIDAFLKTALDKKGLEPAPRADRRTLLRRAYLDLTGLLPPPAEVEAFVNDPAPDAWEKRIDQLLASPHYGERWGRHWLDVARYADSSGHIHDDDNPDAWRYRDYVIRSFNDDKPYDRFVIEQLAGDELDPVTYDTLIATSFHRIGPRVLFREKQNPQYRYEYLNDMIATTSRAFLGLTVACARCHDHKFDPIPQADYYSMAGIFKSSKTMENFKVVAKWHEFVLAPQEDRDRLEAHEARIEAKKKESARIAKAQDEKLVSEAMQKAGAYLMAAQDVDESDRIHLKPALDHPGAVVREAARFDGGNVPRKLERKKANVPEPASDGFGRTRPHPARPSGRRRMWTSPTESI